MKNVIIGIIEALLVVAIVVFLVIYFIQSREYKKGAEEYSQLSEYAEAMPAGSGDKDLSQLLEDAGIPELSVDFDSLAAKNEDVTGWIYLPGFSISYPVVQGEDDDYYLHRTFEKEENTSGCIFLESKSAADLTDRNTFLFGHNMKNGSMFGSLKRFLKEEDALKNNPDFYYYTPECAYRFEIYSYYIAEPSSHTFFLCENDEEYSEYQQMALDESVRDCNVSPDTDHSTLTLATCSGSGANKKRLVVHGIMKDKVVTR